MSPTSQRRIKLTSHVSRRMVERKIHPAALSRAYFDPEVTWPGRDGTEIRQHGEVYVIVGCEGRVLTMASRMSPI